MMNMRMTLPMWGLPMKEEHEGNPRLRTWLFMYLQ
ncbi:hypothetical protein LINPERPRIM_LOCUS22377, partial [Linum perenne]